eukprot:CAMPEP_0195529036 /NCGR_PEP_ID=MMETSP0794_2-20130614/31451_1 /TAXON_ID=515487 /ORGANISM="Stephanopyxis turris, Strain CCMP 815" /LENGTH=228 /DNA_ID=CAMNT_0040660277 /DNA_START=189 /DNA_END=875 /DNA_ORIENTATION=+
MTADGTSRRDILSKSSSVLGNAFLLLALGKSNAADAFDNRISDKYNDRPKQRGGQPKDLGIKSRKDMFGEDYQGLKHCGNGPNCFCSTESPEDDPGHYIPSWKWPEALSKTEAFEQISEVVNAYEPGQGNIDGGGFKVITFDKNKGYIYAQFEALKNGYIDDFEIAFIDGLGSNNVQVRSSSRLGYLDYGVNAKRLNFIANGLRKKGWYAPEVSVDNHQNYFIENGAI